MSLIAVCILIATSCSDFLNVEPIGKTTTPKFFGNMESIRAALPGCYSLMYEYYSSEFYKYPEVAGNLVSLKLLSANGDMVNEYNFISSPQDEALATGYIWKKIFTALANVNNILYYYPSMLEKFPEETEEIELIRAEALFLRALCHFDVCRVYAQPYNYTTDASHLGVPVLLKTPGADDNVGRSSVKAVYDQIIKDLKDSEIAFGDKPMKDAWHASKLSTQALLSRVYLYMEDWENSITYSNEVLKAITIVDRGNYTAMYNNNIVGGESLFRLNGLKKSSQLAKFYYKLSPVAIPSDSLISLFYDPNDIRFALFERESSNSSSYLTLKFTNTAQVTEKDKHYDPIVLRASEILLNRAEAYIMTNQLDKASEDLKTLISRNLGVPTTTISLPEGNKQALLDRLKKERAMELCFEGHQFFDITRWKQNLVRPESSNSNVKFLPYPNERFVLPIPQTELDANKNMVGNPGINN